MAANARSIRGNERGGNVSRLCDERRELLWSADAPAALTERADQRGPHPARLDDLVQRPHPARALDGVDGVQLRSDSGEPSKPERLARMTTGRLPLAASRARATFLDERGNSVPAFHAAGPSSGRLPSRGTFWLSIPIRQIGTPPRCASHTIADSAPAHERHRSRWPPSWSMSARMTARMANGRFRPGLVASSKISPTVANPWSCSGGYGYCRMSRLTGSIVRCRRGPASPGTTYV